MEGNTFKVQVITGRGIELEREARSVTLVSDVGEIGILPQHCDYVGTLASGVMTLEDAAGKKEQMVVTGGFCSFTKDLFVILADKIDFPATVTLEQIISKRQELVGSLEQTEFTDPKWPIIRLELDRLQAIETLPLA